MCLNTRAFAIASGAVSAFAVFGTTILVLVQPGEAVAPPLARSLLFGYSVTPAGAFIGAMWGYVYGFLLGGGLAFVYNLAAAPQEPPAGD